MISIAQVGAFSLYALGVLAVAIAAFGLLSVVKNADKFERELVRVLGLIAFGGVAIIAVITVIAMTLKV